MRILPDRMGFMRLRHQIIRSRRWPVTVIARIGAGGLPSPLRSKATPPAPCPAFAIVSNDLLTIGPSDLPRDACAPLARSTARVPAARRIASQCPTLAWPRSGALCAPSPTRPGRTPALIFRYLPQLNDR
jgi:hypothetical protein